MRLALKLAAVLAANLALWPAAWLAVTTPAGTSPIASPRDAGKSAGALADLPKLEGVLDFSHLSPVQAYSRPLFVPSRRAWEPPPPPPEPEPQPVAAAPPPPPMPAPALRLVGVSSLGDSDIRALVQLDTAAEPMWVLVGDVLMGWKVGKIEPQSITIQRGKQRMSVALYPEAGRAP
jgi:hypothetical protein